jgi:hypothetical protein
MPPVTNKAEVIKEAIKNEYQKCALDPVYFMQKYIKIQHPVRGTIPLDPYPFQRDALNFFAENRFTLILKSRQMGITTLIAAYSLWLMIFNKDKNVLVISIKQETSKEIITKVRFANDRLPSWLKRSADEDNKLSLRLDNGSQIAAVSAAADAARSKAISLLILDEAAFIDDIEEIWKSAYNTLSTGGRSIVLSTPNGVGNWFHQKWVEAEKKKNDFRTMRLMWSLHPERNQSWRDEQTKQLGIKGASQECDCSFISSGNNVIDLNILSDYEENKIREPKELRRNNSLWIFDYPDPHKDYIVCADCARGDGSDYSAAHVLDIDTLEQVAEFQDQIPTDEFGDLLVSIATEYNDALLVVERENIGWAVLQTIVDRQYKNTFYSSNDLKIIEIHRQMTNRFYSEEKKVLPGFSTTIKTRPLIVSKLEAYFRSKEVDIRSIRLINELKTFIWDNNKAQAAPNYNDDLIMSLGIGLWVRDTAIRLRQEGVLLTKAMLGKLDKSTGNINISPGKMIHSTRQFGNDGREQWYMKTGRNNETEKIDWLL